MVRKNRPKLVFSDNTIELLNGNPTLASILSHIEKSGKCSIPIEKIQLFADGVEIDMNSLATRLSNLPKEPKCINIGRRFLSQFQSTNKLEDETRELKILDETKSCPRIRGYQGFVPGQAFGYGMGQYQIDRNHQKPQIDIEKEKQTHDHPCLGYEGHVRGKSHVAGRTWDEVIKDINEHNFEELVAEPFIPDEIPAYRQTTLDDSKPSILKLITPPTSPKNQLKI